MNRVVGGDHQSIVEERADSTNVNNWHWTERDTTSWAKEHLEKSLLECRVDDASFGYIQITDAKVQGDSTVGSRKGKVYCIYDLELDMTWKGRRHDEEEEMEGTLLMKDVTQDLELTDVSITFTSNSHKNLDLYKSFIKKSVIPKIEEKVIQFSEELRSLHGKAVLLPTSNAKSESKSGIHIKNHASSVATASPTHTKTHTTHSAFTDILIEIEFVTDAHELLDCFLLKEKMIAWTRGELTMDTNRAQKGTEIVLFGGNITMHYLEITVPNQLVVRWRSKEWPVNQWSTVHLTFSENERKDNHTVLHLKHTHVPTQEADRIRGNWYLQVFNPIKAIFGYGNLF